MAFHEKAERRLTTEHPGLAQALLEHRQAKQHQAALATAKATIEHFNNQPTTARGILLEQMRREFKRDPAAAEKLTKQLGQGNDRGFER